MKPLLKTASGVVQLKIKSSVINEEEESEF